MHVDAGVQHVERVHGGEPFIGLGVGVLGQDGIELVGLDLVMVVLQRLDEGLGTLLLGGEHTLEGAGGVGEQQSEVEVLVGHGVSFQALGNGAGGRGRKGVR